MERKNIRIRMALVENEVKQHEVAKTMGIHESQLSRMLRDELPKEKQDEIIEIIKTISEQHSKPNDPKMYGREIIRLDGEITDELIYSDICVCLKNAGVLEIGKSKNSAKWAIKACKWEGQ